MSRYIDADELLNALQGQVSEVCNKIPYDKEVFTILHDRQMEIYNLIEKQPTADVVEVVHASWEAYPSHDWRRCSVCKKEQYAGNVQTAKYCPNCGAKMDGNGDNLSPTGKKVE